MQDDRFQDNLDEVSWAKKRTTFSICFWTSWPKTNLRMLTRLLKRLISQQKLFYMAETFHLMLKFNFLHNVIVNTCFFPMNTYFRDLNLLIKYKLGQLVSWLSTKLLVLICHFFISSVAFLTIWATSHRHFGTCICTISLISSGS